jgi:hypothetical protein
MALEMLRVGSEQREGRASDVISRWRYLSLHLLVGAAVMMAGAIEGRYGRSELFGDDISYLDVANMIRVGDWKAALNPLWSIGYPMLLSVVRHLFPLTPRGEVESALWLNLLIYLFAWIGFLWLLRSMWVVLEGKIADERAMRLSSFLLICSGCIFVSVQTGVGRVSTLGPDLLVACIFFFVSGFALQVYSRSENNHAALWGALLGFGVLSKAIFFSLAGFFFAIAICVRARRHNFVPLYRTAAMFLLFVIPYAMGLSWALGRPTFGEAGALNYAFHVNHLPHWMGWQGGPKELGSPIHPVRLLSTHPPVFAFGEPFHVTYPPQFNMVYWYEGYHRFFSFRNAADAFLENVRSTKYVFQEILPVVLVILLCFCVAFWSRRSDVDSVKPVLSAWVLYLPSILGFLTLLLIHMEGRYVAGFICVLAMAPFLQMDRRIGPVWPALRTAALVLLVAATLFNSWERLHGAVRSAVARKDMQSGGQWAVAEYLQQMGLRSGDKVASVSAGNDIRCTWAYGAGLHVVAAIGNDAFDPKNQVEDLHLFFDDPSTQEQVLQMFREQGAVAVVATDIPFDVSSPGWQHVPGSKTWVHVLEPATPAGR